jgi:predicted DNA-binding transcriptional regulator YafY
MASEAKKLALLRILEILRRDTDEAHPLTHNQIADLLLKEYGIEIERKAVGRNISLLLEADYDIVTTKQGVYLNERKYEPSEIRLLIDGVLSSQHIGLKHSRDLIEKLADEENKYFKKNIKHIHAVADFEKTENASVFYNIDTIHEAIELGKMVEYDYNKYGPDKKLHKTSFQRISPYQLILHNQRYYLMGYSSYWGHITYHRLDRITNIIVSPRDAVPIREVEGFESGINYKNLTTAMPYMFSDTPETVELLAVEWIIDQVIDWFGKDIKIEKSDKEGLYKITLKSSPTAMLFWAMQYTAECEVVQPISLRERIKETIHKAKEKYGD